MWSNRKVKLILLKTNFILTILKRLKLLLKFWSFETLNIHSKTLKEPRFKSTFFVTHYVNYKMFSMLLRGFSEFQMLLEMYLQIIAQTIFAHYQCSKTPQKTLFSFAWNLSLNLIRFYHCVSLIQIHLALFNIVRPLCILGSEAQKKTLRATVPII